MTDYQKYLLDAGAVACSALPADALFPYMPDAALQRFLKAFGEVKSVIVALFPYFAGNLPGNIAKYARGKDYHLVVQRKLQAAAAALEASYPGRFFIPKTDSSPIPEVMAAYLSGAGILGQNGLILCPPYGSYLFIGELLTDLEIEPPRTTLKECSRCGSCVQSCPSGALSMRDGKPVFDESRCLSHITQKKGELSPSENESLTKADMIWGCDICLDSCPHNKTAHKTAIADFSENLVCSLSKSDVNGLSSRAFLQRFPERAFTWRGVSPLLRNLNLKDQ